MKTLSTPFLWALCGLAALGACASLDRQQTRREAAAQRIVADALAYNHAYQRAITGQVLLNIMRASNRQPRQYTTLSGFNQEGGRRSASLSIGGIELDNLGESWGEGEIGAEAQRPVAPDYTVSPFATDAYANLVLRPVDRRLFSYYWDTGWNTDLLLMLLVERVRIAGEGPPRDLRNSAGTIANDCTGGNDEGGCAFVLAMRELARDLSRSERIAPPPPREGECRTFAAYIAPGAQTPPSQPRRAVGAQDDPSCPVEIVVAGRRYLLALRSLDDVIYHVGALMRSDPNAAHPPAGEQRARLGVAAPAVAPQLGRRTPIFRIVEATPETERTFAATVAYGGRRYSAGAPTGRFCYVEGDAEACSTSEYLDMSGSVLELLAGILAFNQSDEVVAPPQNSVLDVR